MKKTYLFGFVLLSLVIISCSKYEEGSYLTLIPKKMRICAEWELTSAEDSLGNIDNLIDLDWNLKINRDETFEFRQITYEFGYVISDQTFNGIWKFIDNKKTLALYFPDSNISWKCPILKLTSSDLKIKLDGDYLTFFTYDLI